MGPERGVVTAGELDVLLHRIHWYLGEIQQVARTLVAGTGAVVEAHRGSLAELDRAISGQRQAVAELREVLAHRLLEDRVRMGQPA